MEATPQGRATRIRAKPGDAAEGDTHGEDSRGASGDTNRSSRARTGKTRGRVERPTCYPRIASYDRPIRDRRYAPDGRRYGRARLPNGFVEDRRGDPDRS